MLTSAFGENFEPLKIQKKKQSWNRLVSLNAMMNRLAATGKGLNPDNADELDNSARYKRATKTNNKFFHKNLAKWFNKTNEDGTLYCANHQKIKKNKNRRRRSDETDGEEEKDDQEYDLQYHWANICSLLEDSEDACGHMERGKKTIDFSANYGGHTKRLFGALKKWTELFLSGCKKNEATRYRRSVRIMARRLFDGVRSELITIDDVRKGKWKRVFPKHIDIYENEEAKAKGEKMDKSTLISMVERRYDQRIGN